MVLTRFERLLHPPGAAVVWLVLLALALGFAPHVQAAKPPRDARKDGARADALFTNNLLLNLQLEIPATNINRLRQSPHLYVSGKLREGDKVYEDVGIHLKGSAGSFRQVDEKPGFTLNFNTFEASSRFHGLKKFHLNNCVQDGTYLSEWLCMQLFREAGVPAPRIAHALVELNGRKLGLYALMESNDRDFLAQYFKNTRGNIYGQPGGGDITDPLERMDGTDPLDRADLKALAAAAQEEDAVRRWEQLQQKLDVNRFLSFMALEIMLFHWDGYTFARHNYRVYQDLDTGKMVFFPHDLDQMIGDPNVPIVPPVNGLVAQAILSTPRARGLYRERFGSIYTNFFRPDVLTSRVDKIVADLGPGLRAYDTNFARDFANNAQSLKERILARARALDRQLSMPGPKPVNFTNNVANVGPWQAQKENTGNTQMEQLRRQKKTLLYIKSHAGPTVASWRTSVMLEAGKYRFSGQVRTVGLIADTSRSGAGGGIRISGAARENKLEGDNDWTRLEYDFQLDDNGEVVLVCELRASKGEIWFDTETLQLERLKK